MTQRIFDVDNKQDVKDLFELLPSGIQKIRWTANDSVVFLDKDGVIINSNSLFCIAWRNKTEITRPVDESKWIGCLCWFWDVDPEHKILGFLKKIDTLYGRPYQEMNGFFHQQCRPVRRVEIKFVEDVE